MVYIDLNMVRTGVVKHPVEYQLGGFNEIRKSPKRYNVIDHKVLRFLFSIEEQLEFQQQHNQWVESAVIIDRAKLSKAG